MAALLFALLGMSLLMAIALTWLVRALGRRLALLDAAGAGGHDKALRSVPNIGGIAIFWTIAVPAILGVGLAQLVDPAVIGERLPALAEHIPGLRQQTPLALGLVGCLLVLHAMGLWDDRRAMGPWPKLLVMVGAALVITIVFDVRLLSLLDDRVGGAWLSIILTVLWLVVVTNAMNFMDNMDGLAAGVGAIAGALFLIAAMVNEQWFVGAMLALLIGALLGFLVFNAPRPRGATIFMGDGGSLVVGFLLAFLTVRTTYVGGEGELAARSAWYAVFMPLCVLAVPIYDFLSVTLIRISQGKSPFVGDRQHFSHRLLGRGMSQPKAMAIICGCTAITGIAGVLLARAESWQAILIGVQTILGLVILAIAEHGLVSRQPGPRA